MSNKAQQAREINDTIRYTMWSVFRLDDTLGGDARPRQRGRRGREAVRRARRGRRRRPRCVRRRRPARRRRPDGLVARRHVRGAAGGLPPLPSYGVRPPPRAGLVADGAAPPGGVQQEPRAGVPGRRGAEGARLRLPVRAVLRVVPPRGRPSAAGCSPSTARWPATTPTSAPTRSPASRSATTSGSSPSRPTSCYRIVDLMRHLRGSEARRHVREEVPFYTGARVAIAELVDRLP